MIISYYQLYANMKLKTFHQILFFYRKGGEDELSEITNRRGFIDPIVHQPYLKKGGIQ